LFNKIKDSTDPERIFQVDKVMDRIDRASLNMQYLTETLLWLSRQEMQTLPCKVLELDKLLEELVDEMSYLLDRKEVSLQVDTTPCTTQLPEFPVRIVLGNLIRNAFQHTWEGCISIKQEGSTVIVFNPQSPAGVEQHELGFGLGLQLTIRLTDKLGWKYVDDSTADTHHVSVVLGGEHLSR
jgi:signal transduction histidine kinase